MQYPYTVSDDTLNGQVSLPDLENEIRKSSIVAALDYVQRSGNNLTVYFKANLSTADQLTLSSVLGAHDGIPVIAPEKVEIANEVVNKPFAAKFIGDKNLFKRICGESYDVVEGENDLIFSIPYAQIKINGMEIINGDIGDTCDFIVLDTPTGYISSVPNYKLNQFGFKVAIADKFYSHRSEYDADMILGMQLKLVYNSISAKKIYVNYELNELK